MNLTVIEQIKLFIFLIPFVLVCVCCFKTNLPRKYRGRQVLMPILAILLSIYAIFKVQQLTGELNDYLNKVIESITSVGEQPIKDNTSVNTLIDQAQQAFGEGGEASETLKKQLGDTDIPDAVKEIVTSLQSFFGDNFELNLLIAYFVNLACALAFLIIKGILLPILNRIWANDDLMAVMVSRFYDKNVIPSDYYEKHDDPEVLAKRKKEKKKSKKNSPQTENQETVGWFVKPQTTSYHKLLMGAYVGVFIAASLVFLVSVFHPEWAFFKASFYPVFIILVFGEVVAFLYGLEYEKDSEPEKVVEPPPAPRNPNYRKIWEEFRNTYPGNILRRTPDLLGDELPEQPAVDKDLGFLLNSEDENLKTVAMYFAQFPQEEIEPSYAKGCVQLLQGKSTLFCNPFYEDLGRYLFPPIIYNLLSYKKCLFIMGRDSTSEDFVAWLRKGIRDFVGADGLWQTDILSEAPVNLDLGVLQFSDIYNLELLNTNREFFSKIGFVFILEPSRLLATGQLALSLIIQQLDLEHCEDITYCACDHNCDGLVDCLSHALKTSMTDVVATLPGNGSNLQVFWDADSQNMQYKILENVTHYLGIGTEIGLIGMRNHVCNTGPAAGSDVALQNECWFSCDKFPVKDMMWIAGQYYNQICQYIRAEIGQEQFNKNLVVRSNIWHCPKAESTYLIVEDEYNNLFEMARIFSSRSLKEGFVNVISGHYLLRDYMIEYIDLFQSDPKAIPTVVPDYARTERNILLKLLMMMTAQPLSEEFIRRELMLGGMIKNDKAKPGATDIDRKTYSDDLKAKLENRIIKHIIQSESTHSDSKEESVGLCRIWHEKTLEDGFTIESEPFYELEANDTPIKRYLHNLKNAYFICEDEQDETHFISAKLYGHVLQSYLPKQFITLDGKYYQIVSISHDNGIVLRRAADHIHKRLYYRQVRNISLRGWSPDGSLGACHHITFTSGMRMEVARGFADYDVKTPGYLECAPYHDIKHARYFELDDIFDHTYVPKSDLKIYDIPSMKGKQIATITKEKDEKTGRENYRGCYVDDSYYGWYKIEYKGVVGWIYPKNELDRSYHHKMTLRLRLPKIAREVIDYKLRDIQDCTVAALDTMRRKCDAVDRKVLEAKSKAMLACANDKNRLEELESLADEEGFKAKRQVRQNASYNLSSSLKLRDALILCDNNEQSEALGGDIEETMQSQVAEVEFADNSGNDVQTQNRAYPVNPDEVELQNSETVCFDRSADVAQLNDAVHRAIAETHQKELRKTIAELMIDEQLGKVQKQVDADRNYLKDVFNSLNDPQVMERVRFTLCLLLSEIFKTTYPESWQYIEVVTPVGDALLEGSNLKYANYHFDDQRKNFMSVFEHSQRSKTANEDEIQRNIAEGAGNQNISVPTKMADHAVTSPARGTAQEVQTRSEPFDPNVIAHDIEDSAVSDAQNSGEVPTEADKASALDNVHSIEDIFSNGNVSISDWIGSKTDGSAQGLEFKITPTGSFRLLQSGKEVAKLQNEKKSIMADDGKESQDDSVVAEELSSGSSTVKTDFSKDVEEILEAIDSVPTEETTADDQLVTEGLALRSESATNSEASDMASHTDEDPVQNESTTVDDETPDTVQNSDEVSVQSGASSEDPEVADDSHIEDIPEEPECTSMSDENWDYIYVFEDSEIDLGLTVSVERYLDKYLEMIYDVLVWHTQKVHSGYDPKDDANGDEAPEVEINLDVESPLPEQPKEEKPKGWFARFLEWLKELFESKETTPAESTDNATNPEDEIHEDKPLQKALHDYIDQCFLKYGDTKFDKALAIKETIAYLGLLGYDANRFDKARAKAQETRDKKEAEAKEKGSA